MQYIADAGEAGKIDGISISEIGIPSFVLMERAALALADAVCAVADSKKDTVLAVCGVGNNGGDGMAALRILQERGFCVQAALVGNAKKMSDQMQRQLSIAKNLGIPLVTDIPKDCTILIDALFGIGLSRPVAGEYASWIQKINDAKKTVIAADIPSGIDASSGQVLGIAVRASYTVTFGVNKLGLVLFPGAEYAGKVLVKDIGFPKKAIEQVQPQVFSYERADLNSILPKRHKNSNKGTYGRVLILAGSENIGGAAYFAAAAAYLTGAGLVRVFTHENNRSFLLSRLPEALLSTYHTGEAKEDFLKKLEESIAWADAVALGPGIGCAEEAQAMLLRALSVRDIPVVLDADGLNLLAAQDAYFGTGRSILLPDNFVLTPHVREMSRLLQKSVAEIKANLIGIAKQAAQGATLVLKDARTVVSDGTRIYLNQSGNNALAKGGSGDVLSGIIGGFLAQKMKPFDAAALAVYLHGLTAEEYVKSKGFSSMLASDILNELKGLVY